MAYNPIFNMNGQPSFFEQGNTLFDPNLNVISTVQYNNSGLGYIRDNSGNLLGYTRTRGAYQETFDVNMKKVGYSRQDGNHTGHFNQNGQKTHYSR